MAQAIKHLGVLGVVLAIAAALAGAVAARSYGFGAYQASALAAMLNWIAGSLALGAVLVAARNKKWRVQGALLAMGLRMALPLTALAILTRSHHPLVEQGVAGLIVVHYLVGLVVETLMSVRLSSPASSRKDSRLALDAEI